MFPFKMYRAFLVYQNVKNPVIPEFLRNDGVLFSGEAHGYIGELVVTNKVLGIIVIFK